MKANVLRGFNAILAFLLTLLGFTACESPKCEYGVPHADFDVSGEITDQDDQPLENIQVRVRDEWGNTYPAEYTDIDGAYRIINEETFPSDSMDIIVRDTAGVYESDSVRIKTDYDLSGVVEGGWYQGQATIHHDFQLRKK